MYHSIYCIQIAFYTQTNWKLSRWRSLKQLDFCSWAQTVLSITMNNEGPERSSNSIASQNPGWDMGHKVNPHFTPLTTPLIGLSHSRSLSSCINHPRVPDNQGQPLGPRACWNYSNQPIPNLLALPRPSLPLETTVKSLAHSFPLPLPPSHPVAALQWPPVV